MTRQPLKPCGTPAAWRRHKRHGEDACAACCRAHSQDVTAFKQRRRQLGYTPPRQLHPCGSEAAFQRHKRRREAACGPCLKAHNDYNSAARRRAA